MRLFLKGHFIVYAIQAISLYGILRFIPLTLAEIYFEAKLNSKSGRVITIDKLNLDGATIDHGHMHVPCPYLFIYQAFNKLDKAIEGATLVDYGCGLGRVLFFATLYPFCQIVGVEASPNLSQESSENLEFFYRTHKTQLPECKIVQGDAADFNVPVNASIFFFNDPFDETVMAQVISKICESHITNARDIYVIYVNPSLAGIFENHGFEILINTVNANNKGFVIYKRPQEAMNSESVEY